jgi:hypothetical protein
MQTHRCIRELALTKLSCCSISCATAANRPWLPSWASACKLSWPDTACRSGSCSLCALRESAATDSRAAGGLVAAAAAAGGPAASRVRAGASPAQSTRQLNPDKAISSSSTMQRRYRAAQHLCKPSSKRYFSLQALAAWLQQLADQACCTAGCLSISTDSLQGVHTQSRHVTHVPAGVLLDR